MYHINCFFSFNHFFFCSCFDLCVSCYLFFIGIFHEIIFFYDFDDGFSETISFPIFVNKFQERVKAFVRKTLLSSQKYSIKICSFAQPWISMEIWSHIHTRKQLDFFHIFSSKSILSISEEWHEKKNANLPVQWKPEWR